MGDSIFMYVLQQVDHLRDIKYFDILVEFVNVCFDEVYVLSAFAVLQYKIEALLILERRP